MEKEFYFEATVDGCGIDLYVTKRNQIMIEESEDNSISEKEIELAAGALSFNTCFDTPSKIKFAKSCHFNNILISKREINDDTNNGVVEEYYLSELRKSPAKLRKFLSI